MKKLGISPARSGRNSATPARPAGGAARRAVSTRRTGRAAREPPSADRVMKARPRCGSSTAAAEQREQVRGVLVGYEQSRRAPQHTSPRRRGSRCRPSAPGAAPGRTRPGRPSCRRRSGGSGPPGRPARRIRSSTSSRAFGASAKCASDGRPPAALMAEMASLRTQALRAARTRACRGRGGAASRRRRSRARDRRPRGSRAIWGRPSAAPGAAPLAGQQLVG
jgi:hypothetical protein